MLGYSWNTLQLGVAIFCTVRTSYGQTLDIDGVFSDDYKRQRPEKCAAKYEKITSDHSACLQPTWRVTATGVSVNDKKVILDMHNTVRREVSPTASDMMLMSWDNEIANTAQRWVETCTYGHDKPYKRYAFGRFTVGQNLATGQANWKAAVDSWAKEKDAYTHNGDNDEKQTQQYTQMVWSTSAKIGCGYALCGPKTYYGCNYGPAGNTYPGVLPYTSGYMCADCPNNCNNGLCDCRGKVCLNGGDMDLSKCTCKCTDGLSFYYKATCGLNCTRIKEPWQCQTEYIDQCDKFAYVPLECPVLCGWCPTAAFNSSSVTSAASYAVAVFAASVHVLVSLILTELHFFCIMI